jgi:hypothetical protein
MISSEVQRTLVKSPPELWAELSDPASLSRHLGELGEIRITRTVPEKTVEWEAEDTTGTVLIKSSGWGTKVTLTVAREIVLPEPPEVEDAPEPAIEAAARPASDQEPVAPADEPYELEPVAPADEPYDPEFEPRRGFFARLFRRHRREEIVESTPVELDAIELEPATETPEEDVSDAQEEKVPDISAELKAAEEVAAEQVKAVLTGMLDRLGAAHHRPFSRS